ncbi:MAG TPA: RNA methyltransferase [Solirubrobacterales bacterium]|jgi:TrmH family RNA methyltransferase|nr:RNA methyltransferase [Solirubrobacterales bacterium]
MIESKDNEKLKLVRKLRVRKHRDREGLFATEGEDLLAAGLAAGAKPRFVLVAGGTGLHGTDSGSGATYAVDVVHTDLLASVSSLGSSTRAIAVWPLAWAVEAAAPCVYLHAVGDPGNVGTIIRTAHALLDATVALGPDCADPFGPKATRASMGSIFSRPPARAEVTATPEPRIALVAHGGEGVEALAGAATLCLGAERQGLPDDVLAACASTVTIPLRGSIESLNVAAAAAIACERISSPVMSTERPDA